MVDYFMAYNFKKIDGWTLIGAWAATGRNTVHVHIGKILPHPYIHNFEKWILVTSVSLSMANILWNDKDKIGS